MKSPVCGRLAAALGAALIVLALGGVAHAQKLYTDREVELRSSPGDDSQVVKRVAKGKSLEVVKRLGTWVRVKYEGRTGWVRRTALSDEPGGGGGDDSKGDSAKEDDEPPKAAAAGAKRTAAKKKADRKKSRSARHKSVSTEEADEELSDEVVEAEDGSGKPRSTWSDRSREAGGPMKVEVQALSVRAYAKRNGKGKVVFTLTEGDVVRVVERGENRWLLVENGKKNTGWIPASAVRDNGDIPEARKSSKELAEDAGEEEETEAPKKASRSDDEADEGESSDDEESGSKKSKKTRTAAADDDESSDDESSSGDDAEASLSDTSDDAMVGKAKPWMFVGSLHAGFTAVGMDVTPTGQDAEVARYNGPIAGLDGEFIYRIRPKIGILAQVGYDWATALGGLTFQAGGNDEITDISLMTHRIGASAGVAYGKRAVGSFRLGYQYMSFQISDLANEASWPRETTSGPTAGLGFSYAELAGKLGARVGVDAMLLGSRTQTEGLRDGTEFDSLTSLWGSLRLDYPIGKSLVVDGGYRFGYAASTWTGISERNTGTDTERTETSHEISIGAGWRL